MSLSSNEVLLDELVVLYDSLHKTPKVYVEDGYPMIRVTDIKRGSVSTEGTMRVDEKTYEEFSKKHKPELGDIILSRVGSYGNSAIVLSNEPFCLGQNTVCLSPIRKKVFPHYLYCCLNSRFVLSQFDSFITGASQPTISLKNIRAVRIPLQRIEVQQRVSQILSAYDDLIENNRRRIQLLEESARLLYKEWFVRFCFPGHEHVKVVDGVPEGWEKKTAWDVMEVLSGGTPKTKVPEYWDGGIPFFTPKDATAYAYSYETEKNISEVGLKNCNSRLYPKDTVFITARGTVGKINLAQTAMAMNQSCYALVGKEPLNQHFLYYAMEEGVEQFRCRAVGAVFDAIICDTFKLIPFLVPPESLINAFSDHASPILKQIDNLSTQNRRLAQARDLLLPRLMNGELAL